MTSFNRAAVGPNFETQVETYVADLNAYEAQMEKVRAETPGHDPYPAPWAPDHIRAAVTEVSPRRYASSFDVVEIDHDAIKKEKAAEALRLRKLALVNDVRRQETEAIAAIDPDRPASPAKRNLALLRAQEKVAAIYRKNPADHTEADKAFLAELERRQERGAAIGLRAAEMISDIEDLTEETVDAWKPGAFE